MTNWEFSFVFITEWNIISNILTHIYCKKKKFMEICSNDGWLSIKQHYSQLICDHFTCCMQYISSVNPGSYWYNIDRSSILNPSSLINTIYSPSVIMFNCIYHLWQIKIQKKLNFRLESKIFWDPGVWSSNNFRNCCFQFPKKS